MLLMGFIIFCRWRLLEILDVAALLSNVYRALIFGLSLFLVWTSQSCHSSLLFCVKTIVGICFSTVNISNILGQLFCDGYQCRLRWPETPGSHWCKWLGFQCGDSGNGRLVKFSLPFVVGDQRNFQRSFFTGFYVLMEPGSRDATFLNILFCTVFIMII